MIKRILVPLLLLFFSFSIFAQNEQYSAPIDWERYKVTEKDFSVLFPKLPVASQYINECNETESRTYYAYAEEVVYFLRIYSKTKSKPPKYCTVKGKFNENSLRSRIAELKNSSQKIKSLESIYNNKKVLRLERETATDLIFDDLKNDRWFELSVAHRKNAEINPKLFFESIDFSQDSLGNEINEGAMRVLGDAQPKRENDVKEQTSSKSQDNTVNSLVVIIKIRPDYTDAARQNNIQGDVLLRVTFLENGGIGEVSVVNALGFGLTENAIAAARKIAFLPTKRDGKNVTVVKSVQFNFSIY